MFDFLLSMWVRCRIDEEYLIKACALKRINEPEKNSILASKQNAE